MKTTRKASSERALLVRLIDEAYDKRAWHGSNLKGAVRRVTAQQAVRPARSHLEPSHMEIARSVIGADEHSHLRGYRPFHLNFSLFMTLDRLDLHRILSTEEGWWTTRERAA